METRLDYDNMPRWYANATVSSTYIDVDAWRNHVFNGDLNRVFNAFEDIKVVKEKPYCAEELDMLYKETQDE